MLSPSSSACAACSATTPCASSISSPNAYQRVGGVRRPPGDRAGRHADTGGVRWACRRAGTRHCPIRRNPSAVRRRCPTLPQRSTFRNTGPKRQSDTRSQSCSARTGQAASRGERCKASTRPIPPAGAGSPSRRCRTPASLRRTCSRSRPSRSSAPRPVARSSSKARSRSPARSPGQAAARRASWAGWGGDARRAGGRDRGPQAGPCGGRAAPRGPPGRPRAAGGRAGGAWRRRRRRAGPGRRGRGGPALPRRPGWRGRRRPARVRRAAPGCRAAGTTRRRPPSRRPRAAASWRRARGWPVRPPRRRGPARWVPGPRSSSSGDPSLLAEPA